MISDTLSIFQSTQDASVNFVFNDTQQEVRYVRRQKDYINIYLSSHNGCNKSCRFCHLTQTGQTSMVESTIDDIINQAIVVLAHYNSLIELGIEPSAEIVNFLFMARGEPLASEVLFLRWETLTNHLVMLAQRYGFNKVVFKISTILPTNSPFINNETNELTFKGEHQPWLYYSLYSPKESFRKKWIPKAMELNKALGIINNWQSLDRDRVVIGHWALIENENDSLEDLDILEAMLPKDLIIRFNLIAYNPASEQQGKASSDEVVKRYFNRLKQINDHPDHRIIGRVGFDVKASCGMFYDPTGVLNEY